MMQKSVHIMKTMNNQIPYECRLNISTDFQNTSSLKNYINKMNRIIDKYSDDTEISMIEDKDISKLIEISEKQAITLRSIKIDSFNKNKLSVKIDPNDINTDSTVKLSIEDNSLRLFLPYLFNTAKSKSSYISDYVKMAFSKYKYENNIRSLWHRFIPPYVFVVKRHVKSRNVFISDNDNFASCNELNVILNTIATEFLLADDWKNMEYFLLNTSVRVGPVEGQFGTEIILFEKTKDNLVSHIEDLM